MKNKIVKCLIIGVLSFSIVACGKSNSSLNDLDDSFILNDETALSALGSGWIKFYLDGGEYFKDSDSTSGTEDAQLGSESVTSDKDYTAAVNKANDDYFNSLEYGELVLTGTASQGVVFSGSDVTYNGVTYVGLADYLNEIDLPYSKEVIASFICESYKPVGSSVQVTLVSDKLNAAIAETNPDYPYNNIGDYLYNYKGYNELASKYSADVDWKLSLSTDGTKNVSSLYGCGKYLMYQGSVKLQTVDVSDGSSNSILYNAETQSETSSTVSSDETVAETETIVEETVASGETAAETLRN